MTEPVVGDQLSSLFLDREVRADPYPLLHQLRSVDPVHGTVLGASVLTRYADVVSVLRHPAASSDESKSDVARVSGFNHTESGTFRSIKNRFLLMLDPPDHTRIRRLIHGAFTARAVERLRPRISELVDELLTAVVDRRSMDLITEFAYPLAIGVICDLLGVPSDDRPVVQAWAYDVAGGLEIRPFRSVDAGRRADKASALLSEYCRALVARERSSPRSELLASLLVATESHRSLDEEELLATCMLLLVAGHETTANLIGNGILTLLQHADQLRRLHDNAALTRPAIEELLRFESPVQLVQRVALEPIEVGGSTIPQGAVAVLLLGAANRDPAQFPEPDRFDITREPNPHVAFSGGPHFCLGAPLARLEGGLAIDALIRRLPDLALADEAPEWRESVVLRGLKSLRLRWSDALGSSH